MFYRNLLLIAVSIAFAWGVPAQSGLPEGITVVKETEKPRLKTPQSRRYRLNPGDVLEISYRYTPEFNQTVSVHPDGFIVLPIVGDVKVADLTLAETKKLIIEKAAKRLKDPEINIFLKEFQTPYYVVAGEIATPGRFEMNEEITALQAVMLAGGFKDSAKTSRVFVFRQINKQVAEVKTLDLKNIKTTSDLENDLNLESGDIVWVPQNRFSKFEKYIRLTSIGSILNPVLRR